MDDSTSKEALLVARSREGDLTAFNVLVASHQDGVYGLCLRMLASPEAAEDTTQEVFLAAYRNIQRFRGGVFRAWLLRIAANACTDELRRRRRRPQVSLDADDSADAPLDLADRASSPEEWALRHEMASHIQAALMRLPTDQRAAVVLCDVQGLSYEETAEILSVSLGTVKSRLSRGRARLRGFLLEERELLPSRFRHTV
ncbi:MAG: sigma-70 family RNA polymerase sigma factor [Dehalococcoidia bacterium]